MLGDFVRGRQSLEAYPGGVQQGILLHRHIDGFVDALPDTVKLRRCFRDPFRRYSGIIIDLALDHELAMRWSAYSDIPLEQFDREVRELLARHDDQLPDRLRRFMSYADRRGLFASYRFKDEVLHSLRGIGRRLSRPNPLHRVDEIWEEISPRISDSFGFVFGQVQSDTDDWLKSRSTITGS